MFCVKQSQIVMEVDYCDEHFCRVCFHAGGIEQAKKCDLPICDTCFYSKKWTYEGENYCPMWLSYYFRDFVNQYLKQCIKRKRNKDFYCGWTIKGWFYFFWCEMKDHLGIKEKPIEKISQEEKDRINLIKGTVL